MNLTIPASALAAARKLLTRKHSSPSHRRWMRLRRRQPLHPERRAFHPDDGGMLIATDGRRLAGAEAIAIGATLRLIDGIYPGMATDPSGNFCVVMNQRFAPEPVAEPATAPQPGIAA